MMFFCRQEIINILRIIDQREEKLKDLNYYAVQGEKDMNIDKGIRHS
jgi:hypothetical protein